MTQNNLGVTLDDLASRSEGPRAAELLNQAVEACRSALQVYTGQQLPQDWAMTQNNLGITLQMYFQVSEFRAGLEQLGRLMSEKGFPDDPRLVSLVHVLTVMCHKALAEEAQATEALHALIAHIEQQAEPFHIAWSFSRLRRVVEQSKVETIVANRKFLLGLLDAASGQSRNEVLASLKRLLLPAPTGQPGARLPPSRIPQSVRGSNPLQKIATVSAADSRCPALSSGRDHCSQIISGGHRSKTGVYYPFFGD